MKFGVVRFPGSCDEVDAQLAAQRVGEAVILWHQDTDLRDVDAVIVPGGFSYGDYLRVGAIARFSPVMGAVERFAAEGGPVLGICNGFQILCEAHLLPGALLRNARLTFVSRPVDVRIERSDTPFTSAYEPGARLRIPVAHGEGRYAADVETLRELEAEGRVVLRYVTEEAASPNGAANDIAGICNAAGNVVGIMPHPERAVDPLVGNADGLGFFQAMAAWRPLAGRTV